MTTLEEVAFLRLAMRDGQIAGESLRRAYVHRRSGKTKRSIPRLLLKNQLAPRPLLEQLCASARDELGEVNDALRVPEDPERLLKLLAKDPESDAVRGLRLGLCLLRECVGVGGEACVYRAKHIAFEHDVVLKALLPSARRKVSGLERLRREAELCSRLQHPNIARVYDYDTSGLVPYVAFEYIPGETLHDRIERFGRLTAAEVVKLGQQIAEGLELAHEQGLLHRDIKPSNIMVTSSGEAKIIDFGFARDTTVPGHITATGFIIGTPYYTAPEYGLEEGIDGRSDLYSLGVTLYFALTGKLPFKSKSLVRLLAMHMQEELPSVRQHVPHAPERLCQIIERLLEKDPDKRFESARALADALADPECALLASAPLSTESLPSESALDALAISTEEEPDAVEWSRPQIPEDLPQYEHIPARLLTCYLDDGSIPEEDAALPVLTLVYPGAPSGDDGIESELPLSTSGVRVRDELPRSEDDLPALPSGGAEPPVWGGPPASSVSGRQRSKRLSRSGRVKKVKVRHEDFTDDKKVVCAACEDPIRKARKILGNIVCLSCADLVDTHELCTACFGSIQEDDKRTAVFRERRYCGPCARRVILYCAHCRERFPLRSLAQGGAEELEGKPYCRRCVNQRSSGGSAPPPSEPETSERVSRRSKVASRSGRLKSRSGSRSGRMRRRRR